MVENSLFILHISDLKTQEVIIYPRQAELVGGSYVSNPDLCDFKLVLFPECNSACITASSSNCLSFLH